MITFRGKAGRVPGRAVVTTAAALALIGASFLVLLPGSARAMPFFSRQVGRGCGYCHVLVPRLNDRGRTFRANGFRFEGEGPWRGVRDYEVLPVSFEAEVEALYDRTSSGGVDAESSDVKIEEVEVMAGGVIDKGGRVSTLAVIAAAETSSGVDVTIPKAFVQANDLAGPRASGMLNARAGKWDVGLPFLNTTGAVITNRYLADSVLGFISGEEKGFELNGAVNRWSGDDDTTAHRYAAGAVTEDLNDANRLRGYYAWYSVTLNESISLGAIYRGGREKKGATDVSYNRYGAAGEVRAGPMVVAGGYFRDARAGMADRADYLATVIVLPWPRVSFAGRFEGLKEEGKRSALSYSLMARYHILRNVYAQAEVRWLNDDDHAAGANEDETKVRFLVVALF
ncbi:MAG: hypothetical protein ACE5EI_09780 [Thermodesulfobacteriota bacterium]